MGIYLMSNTELQRLEVLQAIIDKRTSVVTGAGILSLSRSQVHRLLSQFKVAGVAGIASKRRGKPSNRRYSDARREYVLHLIREQYYDFGPTLVTEKLNELHEVTVSKETVRKWMIEAGLWDSKIKRKKRIHLPRNRRNQFGELIQIDGSHHHWFEDRGPKAALLVYVDDATSKLVHLRFAVSENEFDYLIATRDYLSKYGKPIAFYSDKHSVFRATSASRKDATTGLTQFGRALDELNIDIICANTPQAKGRVERANKTLQDRLVKELRLRNISDIEAANAFMPEFMADYNRRFGKEPHSPVDMHRPLAAHESLDGAMCHKEKRRLTNTLTLRYDKVLFICEENEDSKRAMGKYVTVCDYPDGRLEIQHDGICLPYKIHDKLQSVRRADIVENKRLSAALSFIAEQQKDRDLERSKKAPVRRGQQGHMFEVP